jgi:hypothetical protein
LVMKSYIWTKINFLDIFFNTARIRES